MERSEDINKAYKDDILAEILKLFHPEIRVTLEFDALNGDLNGTRVALRQIAGERKCIKGHPISNTDPIETRYGPLKALLNEMKI